MSPRDEDSGRGPRLPGIFRRIGRAAFAPWRWLRIDESIAAIRRDLEDLNVGGQSAPLHMRLDETGGFDLDGSAFVHGKPAHAV